MKLIVNLTPLSAPLTGIGHYTNEMLKELIKDPRISDIQGFLASRWLNKALIEELLSADKSAASNGSLSFLRKAANFVPYKREVFYAYVRLRHKKKFTELKDYLYWEPNYAPLFADTRTVVSVYDLSHIRYPEFHGKDRVRVLQKGIKAAIEGGARIVSISEFSRSEIADVYGLDESKIKIAPPGVSNYFYKRESSEIERIKSKHGINGDYILSVCTIEPRKNLIKTCEAYGSLSDEIKGRYKLVLVGKSGWLNDDLEKLLRPLEDKGLAIRCGYVAGHELPALYSGAYAFVYMSFYEGYGMPVAEAIKCGAKTLASNKEPMISVGGGAAIYADPNDAFDIADKMRAIINGEFAPIDDKIPQIFDWSQSADMLVGAFLDMDKKEGGC